MSVSLVNDSEIKVHFGPQATLQDCFNLPNEITGTAEYTGSSPIHRQDLTTKSRPLSPICIRGPAIALAGALISTVFLISGYVFFSKALTERATVEHWDWEGKGRTYRAFLTNGIVFTSIGAVCCLASCIFGCISSARKEKVRKDLKQEIIPEAQMQAVARMNALSSQGLPPPY